jgi:hypothetical protein
MQTILDRKSAPSSNKIKSFNLIQAKKNVLDNGIPVYSINAGYQDLAKIEFIFPNISFDLKRPLLNSATNRLMSEGTSKYTSQQLADHIDYYGSFFETEENSDFTSVILLCHLSETLFRTLFFLNQKWVFMFKIASNSLSLIMKEQVQ